MKFHNRHHAIDRPCNEEPCPIEMEDPIDCKWGDYRPLTNCTKPCGNGTQTLFREKIQLSQFGGVDCPEPYHKENVPCNEHPCFPNKVFSSKDKAYRGKLYVIRQGRWNVFDFGPELFPHLNLVRTFSRI